METYTKHEIVSVKCVVFICHCKLHLIFVYFIFLLILLFAIVYIFKTYLEVEILKFLVHFKSNKIQKNKIPVNEECL